MRQLPSSGNQVKSKVMTKDDFIYPDVKRQRVEFHRGTSRREIEAALIEMADCMNTGLLAFQRKGTWVEVFTSVKFLQFKKRMVNGAVLVDFNGLHHKVISEQPFICSGSLCVRTICEGIEDVYECSIFNPFK